MKTWDMVYSKVFVEFYALVKTDDFIRKDRLCLSGATDEIEESYVKFIICDQSSFIFTSNRSFCEFG